MFENRFDAAHQLVPELKKYANNPDALVVAIPRGGLQLGSVLAKELHLPLDVIFTKKIGYPGQPEYAIGAVSLDHLFVRQDYLDDPQLSDYIKQQTPLIRKLLHERAAQYRGNKPPLDLKDKIVIVVDDGVATGNTLLATLALIKEAKAQKIVVALPVSPVETLERIREHADEVVCLQVPAFFLGVGQFYRNFEQVEDAEAIRLLQEAHQ